MDFYQKFSQPVALAKTLISLFLLLLSLAGTNVFGSETADQVARRLHDYYRGIDNLSFSFIQTTEGQMIGRPKTGKGSGLFARTANGAKMRWNYISPDRQILISDGITLSMYFENLNQMIVTPVDKSQADILFSLFAGQGKIEDTFTILDSDPEAVAEVKDSTTGLSVLYLVPISPDSPLDTIHLYVTSDSLIRRIELIDHFETKTTINISNISVNPFETKGGNEIEQLFMFTPPDGTEIINN